MFSIRYAGNWAMSVVCALIAAACFGLPAVADVTESTAFLGQLVAAFALIGAVVLVANAALKRAPLCDWTAPCGTRLHPRAKAALQGLSVSLIAVAGLLGYVSIFIFGLYEILYFGLFMVIVMMSWIIYITAGKHVNQ